MVSKEPVEKKEKAHETNTVQSFLYSFYIFCIFLYFPAQFLFLYFSVQFLYLYSNCLLPFFLLTEFQHKKNKFHTKHIFSQPDPGHILGTLHGDVGGHNGSDAHQLPTLSTHPAPTILSIGRPCSMVGALPARQRIELVGPAEETWLGDVVGGGEPQVRAA